MLSFRIRNIFNNNLWKHIQTYNNTWSICGVSFVKHLGKSTKNLLKVDASFRSYYKSEIDLDTGSMVWTDLKR